MPTVVDVIISGTTATVVDARVDGVTTVAGAAPITNVSGQIPTLGVATNYLAGQGEILSLTNDIANIRANVIITGQTLTNEIGVLSGVLISTGNYLESNILTLSGDLIASGNNLDSLRDILSGNLITTGQTLQTQITSNDSDIASLLANLITTGQTLQTQITSNDGDISTLTSNLVTTGQTLATDISAVSTNLISTGEVVDDISGNLITTGQTLQTQVTANDGDISTLTSDVSTLTSNVVTTGQTLQTQITSNDSDIATLDSTTVKLTTNQSIAGNKIFTDKVTINNLTVTGTEVIVDVENLAVKDNIIHINSGESGAGISRISGGITIDRGTEASANILYNDANDRFELNFPLALEGNLAVTADQTGVYATASNLITTGQTLQTQITSNDSDISTLTTNLVTTGATLTSEVGIVSGLITDNDGDITALKTATGVLKTSTDANTSNLISTGNFLESEIAIVSGIAGGQDLADLSGNLITTGQTLTTEIDAVSSNLVSTGSIVDDVSGNLITTGQTLQTQITSNDTDISNLTSNVITTGQTLTSEIIIVSGIAESHTDVAALSGKVDDISGNLITTGQTLTADLNTVSANLISTGALIDDVSGNLITTGQTLTATIDTNTVGIATNVTNIATNVSNLIETGTYLTSEITIVSGIAEAHTDVAALSGKVDDLSGNLITTGQTLTTDINTVSTNLVSTGSVADDISGNLITTGQTLQTQITSNDGDITTLTSNLITTGQTLTSEIAIVSGIATGGSAEDFAALSGDLITTGQTLQTQITSNDSDISTLTSNLITTGQTLTTDINTVSTNLISTGAVVDDISGNLITTGQTLQTQITSNDSDISTLTSNLISTGSVVDDVSGNLITTGQTLTTSINTNSSNLITTGQTLTSEIAIVSGIAEAHTDISELSGNLITTGQTLTTDINAVSTNLITTGQTLQTQITSNDSDISTLTTNLVTTGQTLTTNIDTVSTNLVSTGSVVDDISGNLITTGQTLTTDINTVASNLVSTGSVVDDISGNLITTGQALQTQITSNDGDITNLTSNLITTGQTLTTEITTVSGLITDNDDDITALKAATGVLKTSTDDNTANLISTGAIVDDVSGNLITSGQTLQTQITSNDSDISTLTSNVITTGQTLQTQITSNDGDITNLTSNLITTGQTLTTDINTVSSNLITTGQTLQTQITSNDSDISTLTSNLVSTGSVVDDISGNLITTGQTLQTQITSNDGDISTLTTNLVTTGQTLTTDINTVSANLVSTGSVVDDISGNLITTGQTLQTQITSNDTDITNLTSNLVTTGQTLTTDINTVSSNLVSTGSVVDDISGNLITTGQTLQTQITSNDGDITSLTSNLVTTGQTLQTQITSNDGDIATLDSTTVKITTNQSVAGNKIFTDTVTINNLTVTGTEVIVDVENLAVRDNIIHINSGESGAGISRISGGITIDRGTEPSANILYNDANDRFELNFPLATEGNLVAGAANLITTGQTLQTQITSNDSDISTLTTNLGTTGQTLQTQITSNDSDISTLTSNLSTTDSNLITTGQTLTTNINTVSTNLVSTGSIVDDISGNLITTGQTLQTQITSNDGDISTLTSNLVTTGQTLTTNINTVSSNLITTGQTLQTQITSNDTDITNLSSNLVTTGQTLTTNIDTVATNLVTTGQTLTSEIITVSGLIPATVIDGGGTANKVPLWSDANTIGDSVISQSSSKIGIGTATPAAVLDIRGDNSTSAGSGLIIGQDASTDGGTSLVPNAWLKFYLNSIRNGAMIKAGRDSSYGSAALADGNLQFHTALNDTLAEHMRIISDGNVGIGTTAPSHPLHVYSTVGNASAILIDGSASNSGYLSFRQAGVEKAYIQYTANSYLRYSKAGGFHSFAQAVAIGTTAVGSYALYVNGTGYFGGPITTTANSAGCSSVWKAYSSGYGVNKYQTNAGVDKWNIGLNSSNEFYIYNYAASEVALKFDTSSNTTFSGALTANSTIQVSRSSASPLFQVTDADAGGGAKSRWFGLVDGTSRFAIYGTNGSTEEFKLDDGGAATFSGSLKAVTILDTNNSAGTSGQILTSTGSALDWKTLSEISGVDGTGTTNYLSKWTDGDTIGNSSIFDNDSKVTIDVPVGIVAGSGSGTLTGRLQIGSTTSSANNSLVFWRGAKPTLAANQGAILYESSGMSDGEGMTFMSDKGYKFLDDAGTTEWVRIISDGNVGIGTTAPARKLHVLGGTVGIQARLTAASGWGTGLEFYDGDTSGRYWRIGTSNNVAGDFSFISGTSTGAAPTATRVTILKDGYVGIGTATPNNNQNVTDRVQLAIGNTAQVGGRASGTPSWFNISHGTYFDGTNWKYYSAADEAAMIEGYNGGLYARMAVAGTNAGDNITWVTALTVLNTGYVHMDGAAQVRLTLGSQGTPGTNDCNWIRGTGTNLGFNAGGGSFHWEVSGTERMNLAASGQLKLNTYGSGTHTGTAAYKLSVTSGGIVIETPIGAGAVDGAGTTNYIPKWTDGDTIGNSTVYNSGSFVGISTASTIASSAELLAVYSASTGHTNLRNASDTYGTIYVRNLSTTASTYQPYIILSDGGGNRGGLGLEYSTSKLKVHGQGGVSFWTGAAFGGGTEKVVIKSDGNVGIGIATPGYKAQIISPSLTWGTSITDASAALSVVKGYQDGANDSDVNVARFASVRASYGATADWAGHISLFTNAGVTDGSEGTERARITWDGNSKLYFGRSTSKVLTVQTSGGDYVGIGTDAPDVLLKLNYGGDDPAGTTTRVGAFSIEGNHITFDVGVNTAGSGTAWMQTRHKDVSANPTAYYPLIINPLGGKVGIGTTAPGYLLDVNGTANIVGALTGTTAAFNSTATGNIAVLKSTATSNNTELRLGTTGDNAVITGSGGSNGGLEFITYGAQRALLNATGLAVTGAVTATGVFKSTGSPSLSAATASEAILTSEGTYGAFIYGQGTTYDVTLGRRNTAVALGVLADTVNLVTGGTLAVAGALTGTSATFSGAVELSTAGSTLYLRNAENTGNHYIRPTTGKLTINNASGTEVAVTSTGLAVTGTGSFTGQLTLQNDDATLRVRSNTTTTKGVTLRYNHAGSFGELRSDQAGVNQLDMKYYALTHKFGRNDSLQYLTIDANGMLHIKADNAYLDIKEADGTAISYLGDLTGAGVGGTFLYNHGGTATIQLRADANHSFINTGGNFGIGTAAPATSLDVRGSGMFGDQTTSLGSHYQLQLSRSNDPVMAFRHLNAAGVGQMDYVDFYFKDTGGTERLAARFGARHSVTHATQPGADFIFSTASAGGSLTEKMRINDDGNVGWRGSHTAEVGKLFATDTDNAAISATNELAIYVNNANVRAMHIDSLGRVGIGTNVPGEALDIVFSEGVQVNLHAIGPLRLENTADATGIQCGIAFVVNNASSDRAWAGIYSEQVNTDDSKMNFWTETANSRTVKMTIANDGNVGIGTTAPAVQLHLEKAGGVKLRLKETGAEAWDLYGGGSGLYILQDGTYRFAFRDDGTQNHYGNRTVNSQTVQGLQDGTCYDFDGTDDYINLDTLASSLTSTAQGTISAWVKPTDATPSGDMAIVTFSDLSANTVIFFRCETDGSLNSRIHIGGTAPWAVDTDGVVFADNTWTHVALVQNGTAPVLYVDGVAVAQTVTNPNNADSTKWWDDLTGLDTVRVGSVHYGGNAQTQFWKGQIRDVKIIPSALTAGEIAQLYSGENPKKNLQVNLLANGDFTSNTTGWASSVGAGSPTTLSIQSGISGATGNVLKIVAASSTASGANTSFATVAGKHYKIKLNYAVGDISEIYLTVGTAAYPASGYGNIQAFLSIGTDTDFSEDVLYEFKATATTTLYLSLIATMTANAAFYVDNVSVEEVGTLVDFNPRSASLNVWYNSAIVALYDGTVTGATLSAGSTDHYVGGDLAVTGNVKLSTLPSTTANAAVPILFRPTEGTISGDSVFTWNPAEDSLYVNGTVITANYIRSTGSNPMKLGSAAGGVIMELTSTGKVGIGTDTASSILHVDSEISLGQDGNNRSMLGYSNSTNRLYIGTRQSSTNYFDTVSVTSGKVGIGTTSPATTLDVNGTISSFTTSTQIQVWGATVGTQVHFRAATAGANRTQIQLKSINQIGTLELYNGANVAKTVLSGYGFSYFTGGNVGIGLNDPGAVLEVTGNTNKLGIIRMVQRASGVAAYGLDMGLDPTTGDPVFSRLYDDTATESFRIKRSTGLVVFAQGISVTGNNLFLPTAATIEWGTAWNTGQLTFQNGSSIAAILAATALTVYVPIVSGAGIAIEGSGSQVLSIYSTDTGSQTVPKTFLKLYGENTSGTKILQAQIASAPGASASTAGELHFSSNSPANSLTRRMTINENGNVGIGNAAPAELLHVGKGESSVHGQILISADSGLHHYLRLTNGGGTSTHYPTGIWYAPSGRMELRAASGASTSNVAQLVLAADGNVGIGTTNPATLLHVESSLPKIRLKDTDSGTAYDIIQDTDTFKIHEVYNNRDLFTMTSGAVITLSSGGSLTKFDTSNAVIVPNGKVGIGTATARAKLDVRGARSSDYFNAVRLANTDTGSGAEQNRVGVEFWDRTTTINTAIIGSRGSIGGHWGGMLKVRVNQVNSPQTAESSLTDMLVFDGYNNQSYFPTGVVAIGTASIRTIAGSGKSASLTVKGDAAAGNHGSAGIDLNSYDVNGCSIMQLSKGGTAQSVYGLERNAGGLFVTGSVANSTIFGSLISAPIHFITNNSIKATIIADGNVGIGTTAPAHKLDVNSGANTGGINANASGGAYLKLSSNENASYALELKAQYNWGMPMKLTSYGVIVLAQVDGASTTALYANGTERMRLVSTGLNPTLDNTYSLGNASYRWKDLHLGGRLTGAEATFQTANNVIVDIKSATNSNWYAMLRLTSNGTSGNYIRCDVGELYIDGSGPGVTINKALTVSGHLIPGADGTYNLGSTSSQDWKELYIREIDMYNQRLRIYTSAEKVIFRDHSTIGQGITFQARNTEVMTIGDASGNPRVGIGTTTPAYKLEVSGTVSANWLCRIDNTATTSTPSGLIVRTGYNSATATGGYLLGLLAGPDYRFVVQNDGNVGIGTVLPGYMLQVNGSFAATSKSFVIDHPIKPNYTLEYGALEGPEFGVYHRGRVQSDTITLPDYWSGLVRDGTITVQLTPNGSFQHLYVVSTSLTEIKIGAADGETIDCYYVIYGERADLDPLVVEKIV